MKIVRPGRRSLAWAIGVIAFAGVFASWRVWLTGSADRLREDVSRGATLVRQLSAVADALQGLKDADSGGGSREDDWETAEAAAREVLQRIASEGLAGDALLGRVRRVGVELDELRRLRRTPGSWSDPEDPRPAAAAALAAHRRAYVEVRDGIAEVRAELSHTSNELAGKWRQVNLLGIVASLMAVALAGLVYALHVSLNRSKAAEEREHALEGERNRAARLAAMGEMAAGLAHQLNQPLASIHSYLAGCQHRLQEVEGDHGAIVEAMQEAQSEARRASSIVERIRMFVSGQGLHPTLTPVNDLVHEAQMLVAGELRSRGIRPALRLGYYLPPIHADRIHLEQALVNVLRNAIEAMGGRPPDGRVLTIETARADGDEVEVAVGDTGDGLTPEQWKHLFEPFHTSKQGGLGLGLAISRRIVEAHGGRIWVEPNRDHGITVRFRLPCAKEGANA